MIGAKEHDERDRCASYESHLTVLQRVAEPAPNSPNKTREQPDVVPVIDGLIGQIEGDPTGR
ncbi:MAG: hypothetical protein Q8M83_05070 [bacterium]|nr:hypothetical protein [bacterium]